MPVVWAVAAITIAVLIALTAPSSDHPLQRIAIALTISGAVLTLFAARDRQGRVIPLSLALLTGGILLLMDGSGFIQPVTRAVA